MSWPWKNKIKSFIIQQKGGAVPPPPPHKKSAAYDLEFAYSSFFHIQLKLKWQIRSHTPVIPSKTIPDIRQKYMGKKLNMFSDQNGAKTIPFGVACAHTWISLYKGGPAPPRAKKPLIIARLLTTSPPPPNQKNK